jgi:hypothetical protein
MEAVCSPETLGILKNAQCWKLELFAELVSGLNSDSVPGGLISDFCWTKSHWSKFPPGLFSSSQIIILSSLLHVLALPSRDMHIRLDKAEHYHNLSI